MTQKWQESQEWLEAQADAGRTTHVLACKTWQALATIHAAIEGLAAPDQAVGPDGQTLAFWDHAEHHFSLELTTEGEIELFYRNRTTGKIWGTEGASPAEPSAETLGMLRLASGLGERKDGQP